MLMVMFMFMIIMIIIIITIIIIPGVMKLLFQVANRHSWARSHNPSGAVSASAPAVEP
jgi:hypothetical protein